MGDFSIEERAWITGRIYHQIAEYFAHWEDSSFPREQLNDVYRECLHEGLAAQNRDRFVAVMRRWIGKLQNGHSWCYDTTFDSGSQVGFQLERMDEGWIVIGSLIDEVDEGDVIELIDGFSPDEWMAQAKPFVTVRQPKTQETQWQYIMPTLWNVHEAILRVRKRDDKVREFKYKPFRLDADDPRSKSLKAKNYKKKQERTEGRWIRDGEVGYIRIPSFQEAHYAEDALSYVQQFSSARVIIFDVRSNGGGNTPSSLTKAIMDRQYRWWTETSPNIGHLRRRHSDSSQFTLLPDGTGAHCVGDWIEPSYCQFAGKIIALADRYTGSAAEDFLMPIKDTGRGILIGETTWGSTGQPVFFDYKDVHVGIGSVRAFLPDGTKFEGVGIKPDISIYRDREDSYIGRDPVLEKALQILEC
ncbi:S41 family peptidase [Paenibacillus sp. LHD-117]|uniref:S41 family peptidase n=1 Tax=Paenibacillus sp. LHD-117 TaxID=3071412 RepID=UPI0027E15807|nr:S41 family peptidase [Paenibacillus sp. LHD-117]MDQ6417850.1 S41 family peptidase [Paenibacillus sp. LHD-117]